MEKQDHKALRSSAYKTLALWLSICAVMVQSFAPLCAFAMQAANSRGALVVICTAHGVQSVRLDSSGNPPGNTAPANHSGSDCPLCGPLHNPVGAVLPREIAIEAPSITTGQRLATNIDFGPRAAHARPYASRAPPESSAAIA